MTNFPRVDVSDMDGSPPPRNITKKKKKIIFVLPRRRRAEPSVRRPQAQTERTRSKATPQGRWTSSPPSEPARTARDFDADIFVEALTFQESHRVRTGGSGGGIKCLFYSVCRLLSLVPGVLTVEQRQQQEAKTKASCTMRQLVSVVLAA